MSEYFVSTPCREKEALLLLDDQAARVCETSLVPYWPQLRHCLLFRSHFSRVQLFVTLWIVICQASLSIGFPRQDYWSRLPFLPPKYKHQYATVYWTIFHWWTCYCFHTLRFQRLVGLFMIPFSQFHCSLCTTCTTCLYCYYFIEISDICKDNSPLFSL